MKKSEWEPVITPADSYTPDSRPMEGMTYLEHPAPAVYLDSWLVRGASYPRPHVNWEVVNSKPSVNNVMIVKMVDIDASDNVNTQLPENTPPMLDQNMSRKYSPEYVTPVSTQMTALAWPCVDSPRMPMVKHEFVNRRKDTREIELTLPENTPPMIDPNMSRKYSPEYVTPVSTPTTALAWSCIKSPRLSTVKVDSTQPESSPPTTDSIVSMRNWEDGVCRLLIIADDCLQDVLTSNSRNPEAVDIQHGADEIYTGRMSARAECWSYLEDYSDTDSVADLEYKTWDEAKAWEFRNARGYTNVDLYHNSRMNKNREYVSDVDT